MWSHNHKYNPSQTTFFHANVNVVIAAQDFHRAVRHCLTAPTDLKEAEQLWNVRCSF